MKMEQYLTHILMFSFEQSYLKHKRRLFIYIKYAFYVYNITFMN